MYISYCDWWNRKSKISIGGWISGHFIFWQKIWSNKTARPMCSRYTFWTVNMHVSSLLRRRLLLDLLYKCLNKKNTEKYIKEKTHDIKKLHEIWQIMLIAWPCRETRWRRACGRGYSAWCLMQTLRTQKALKTRFCLLDWLECFFAYVLSFSPQPLIIAHQFTIQMRACSVNCSKCTLIYIDTEI